MTKKDYNAMAKVIKDQVSIAEKLYNDQEYDRYDAVKGTARAIAEEYAKIAKRDNDRFNVQQFMQACGFEY